MPKKGVDQDGYVIKIVTHDILCLGLSRVIVKSDNGPAIVHMIEEALKAPKVQGLESAAAGVSAE